MAAARKGAAANVEAATMRRPTSAEMAADAVLDPDAPIELLLDGVPCHVLPARQWRSSAMRALREGDFETWAEGCLDEDDYEKVWMAIDPTMSMVEQFFEDFKAATGAPVGKSRAWRR